MKNHPNTNTNSIRFGYICRIRIRISLFGLNYSNTIRIPNYSLTSELNLKLEPTFQELELEEACFVSQAPLSGLCWSLSPCTKGAFKEGKLKATLVEPRVHRRGEKFNKFGREPPLPSPPRAVHAHAECRCTLPTCTQNHSGLGSKVTFYVLSTIPLSFKLVTC